MKVKKAWFVPIEAVPTTQLRLPQLEGKELSLKDMYPIIGCDTIEHVGLGKGVDMWCDESALLVANPVLNVEATRMYREAYGGKDFLFGATVEDLAIFGNAIITDNTKAGEFIK